MSHCYQITIIMGLSNLSNVAKSAVYGKNTRFLNMEFVFKYGT